MAAEEPQQAGPLVSVQPVELRGDWSTVEDAPPAVFINQFALQVANGIVLLSFGQAIPQLIVGTPEEQAAQAAAMGPVPINLLARVAIPPEIFQQIVAIQAQALTALGLQPEQREQSASGESVTE